MTPVSQLFSSRRGTGWLVYLAIVIGVIAAALPWSVEQLPQEVFAAGVFVWAVALLPLALWSHRGAVGAPMFESICAAYGFAYSMPLFLLPNQIIIMSRPVVFEWNALLDSVLLAGAGIVALMLGYYCASGALKRVALPAVDLPLSSARYSAYVRFALIVGLGAQILATMQETDAALGAILRVLTSQYYIGLVLLGYRIFGQHTPRTLEVILLWGSLLVGTLLGLSGGMLETAFVPLVLVFVVRWHARRRFPIVMALLGAAAILVLNPVKGAYRDLTWWGEYSGAGVADRLSAWTIAVEDVYGLSPGAESRVDKEGALQQVIDRFNLLHKFAQVRSLTPDVVPYFRGASYAYLFYAPIPRVIWPDKPVASDSTHLLDIAYELQVASDRMTTSIGVGQIAEAFANFGTTGVVIVMALQGLVFAFLDQTMNGPNSVGGRAIYLTVMVFFLNGTGTSAVILYGAMIQFIVATAVLIKMFAGIGRGAGAARGHPVASTNTPQLAGRY
jgi:hypothetical protein